MSINKNILLGIIKDEIERGRNKRVNKGSNLTWNDVIDFHFCLKYVELILFSDPTKDCIYLDSLSEWEDIPKSKILKEAAEGCGLPIGNLLAQLWANVILNALDQYIKRVKKVKHWIRYVDDAYAISINRAFLEDLRDDIATFLTGRLQMTINVRKTKIHNVQHDIMFLGADVRPGRTYIQNGTVKALRKAYHESSHLLAKSPTKENILHCRSRINSYLGMMQHYKCHRLTADIIGNL